MNDTTFAIKTSDGQQNLTWMADTAAALTRELVAEYGDGVHARLARGLGQIAKFWRQEDGDRAVFESFVKTHFAGDDATLNAMFERFEQMLEAIDGHHLELVRELRQQVDLDRGPILPFDQLFAAYSPAAHLADDFFASKLAFVPLLNFPLTTLAERQAEGDGWSRRQWAESRLADRFAKRVPAAAEQALSRAAAAARQYNAEYNIWMHHLVDDEGRRLFPAKMRLLAHWNLRDELRAAYADRDNGLFKQRMIERIMERIVNQTIPRVVIDSPHVDWNPYTNEVTATTVHDTVTPAAANLEISAAREPDTRYAHLLACFHAVRGIDPYSPTAPTFLARRFDKARELSEQRVAGILEDVLTSPLLGRIARLIEARLARPLEAFDMWYTGFRPIGGYREEDLDAIVAERYPNADDFRQDIPNLLQKLGFATDRAASIADHIAVDPARGSGHAWAPAMRTAKAHLRTRIAPGGMTYQGFNTAMHELGHNVEEVITLYCIDHTLLAGVPNNAFTEAIAFYFQARDLEMLGLSPPEDENQPERILDQMWSTAHIAAVSLVDMRVWRWLYDHPDADAQALKAATLDIARDLWNRCYAPILGVRDSTLLAIYSHMISALLYLPDYPIGHLITHQIEEHIAGADDAGAEIERMLLTGNVIPDVWMKRATGKPVGAEALLNAAEKALVEVGG